MHEALVNRLGGLSLPRKSVVRLTDRPDMTLDVYPGRKTTTQQQQHVTKIKKYFIVYFSLNFSNLKAALWHFGQRKRSMFCRSINYTQLYISQT